MSTVLNGEVQSGLPTMQPDVAEIRRGVELISFIYTI